MTPNTHLLAEDRPIGEQSSLPQRFPSMQVRSIARPTGWMPDSPVAQPRWIAQARAAQFQAIQSGYERHGGLSTGDELAGRLRQQHAQPVSMLARWIVDGELYFAREVAAADVPV